MNDSTTSFISLLTHYALEDRIVDEDALRAVYESVVPINPLDTSFGSCSTEDRFDLLDVSRVSGTETLIINVSRY
jgi:hypothetical protein